MTMTITNARLAGGTYTPLELFDIDRLLDDDERDIAATVRKFVDTRLRPNIEGWFESATLPKELAKDFGDLGVLGMHLDGYGCAGINAVSYGLACLELAAGDTGSAASSRYRGRCRCSRSTDTDRRSRKTSGSPGWRPARRSAASGSPNPTSAATPPGCAPGRQDGTDWMLNGTKMWITNGGLADVATMWAQTDDGIRGFLVPTDTPGFTAHTSTTSCPCARR